MTQDEQKTGAVQIPRGVLMALVGALAAATLLVAFFMGRESARKATEAQPAAMPAPAQTEQPGASQPTEPLQATALGPSPSAFEMAPPASDSTQAAPMVATPSFEPPVHAAQAAPAAPDKLRDDVARYFREVETIQSQAKSSGDPEAFARTLLEQGVKGDESGFDGLVAANRKVLDALRGVQVPEPCREHHRLTLGLLEESIAMLEHVKSQLQGGNEASLAALPAQGHELERKAKEVDALAADIKRGFGV